MLGETNPTIIKKNGNVASEYDYDRMGDYEALIREAARTYSGYSQVTVSWSVLQRRFEQPPIFPPAVSFPPHDHVERYSKDKADTDEVADSAPSRRAVYQECNGGKHDVLYDPESHWLSVDDDVGLSGKRVWHVFMMGGL